MIQILMSRPEQILGASSADQRHAIMQWDALYETLTQLGCHVHLLPCCPYVEDFFAVSRHGFALDQRMLLSYSGHSSSETSPYLSAWCEQFSSPEDPVHISRTRLHPDRETPLPYAGHADTLFIDNCLYFGYGSYSAHEIANDLITKTGKRVVDLFIDQSQRYLIDTILPVHDGMMLYHDHGLHQNSLLVLDGCFTTATLQDAVDLCPSHSLMIGDHAVVPDNCYETQRMLGELGYQVIPVEMSAYQAMQLGPRGLILPLLR